MPDNGIGVEGGKAVSEMLKVNTTLNTLNVYGQEERKQTKMNKIERN